MDTEPDRQGADGQPHFAYYDKAHELSFIWDGKSTTVEVCAGGYGEPVSDTIDLMLFNPSMFERSDSDSYQAIGGPFVREEPTLVDQVQDWLNWFSVICAIYVEITYGRDT